MKKSNAGRKPVKDKKEAYSVRLRKSSAKILKKKFKTVYKGVDTLVENFVEKNRGDD